MASDTAPDSVDWEAVYWEQTPRLYNFFRYRTGDGDLAKDLTAKTMLRAWRYRHRYQADLGAFEAWLFQIARNVAKDSFAARQRQPLPLDAVPDVAAPLSVEREVQRRQQAEQLYRLIAQLPQTDQDLVALKYGAELTNRKIADLLNLSESNVGTRLHRLLTKLRRQWEMHHALPE